MYYPYIFLRFHQNQDAILAKHARKDATVSLHRESELNTLTRVCPNCKRENEATALTCSNCGASLNDFLTEAMSISDPGQTTLPETEMFVDTALIPEGGIGIRVAGTPKPYYLFVHKELIIGRPTDSDAALESVLDLSDVAAYAMGVSRRHAKIRRTATGFEVIDLDSRNGTWLNAERLVPNKPYPFASGSQLRIGKMRLLLIYQTPPRK